MGLPFEVVRPDVEEVEEGDAGAAVLENALRKAAAGAASVSSDRLVLGADTDVAIGGRLLGKPADPEGARGRLDALSGATHEVHGAIALRRGGDVWSGSDVTRVTFRSLASEEIERYVASGEWEGRAGGYAVQGLGASFVARIEGDLSNVIGLSIPTLSRMIENLQNDE